MTNQTQVPTTKQIIEAATFYDGMGGPVDEEGFYRWMRAVIEDSHGWGMAYEGSGSDTPLEDEVEDILRDWMER